MDKITKNQKGFSLIELLVIVVFIGILVAAGWLVYNTSHSSSKTKNNTDITSSASQTKQPVLGYLFDDWNPIGLGMVKPAQIHLNSTDSTTQINNVTWQSWGDTQAIGQGQAQYSNGGAINTWPYETTTVVAFDLGTCQGKSSYNKIAWFFPQHGQKLSLSSMGMSTCPSSTITDPYTNTSDEYGILAPATVPSKTAECNDNVKQPSSDASDGISLRYICADGYLNVLAWKQLASQSGPDAMMKLGYSATSQQVCSAYKSDSTDSSLLGTEYFRYEIAALYYGWNFGLNPIYNTHCINT